MATRQILVIDDEDDILEVAQLTLEAVGQWQVLTASSGTEGIRLAASEHPDAILLDVMMPDMDGLTTFKELQANPATQDIPVVFLTAKVQPADQRRFAQLGVTAVITKPFNPLDLPDQVAKVLDWAS